MVAYDPASNGRQNIFKHHADLVTQWEMDRLKFYIAVCVTLLYFP